MQEGSVRLESCEPQPGSKGERKGKGDWTAKWQRLDMPGTHDDNRGKALELLEASLVTNDAPDTVGCATATLGFSVFSMGWVLWS